MVFFAMRLLFADVSDIVKYIKELFIVLLTVLFPVFESYDDDKTIKNIYFTSYLSISWPAKVSAILRQACPSP